MGASEKCLVDALVGAHIHKAAKSEKKYVEGIDEMNEGFPSIFSAVFCSVYSYIAFPKNFYKEKIGSKKQNKKRKIPRSIGFFR